MDRTPLISKSKYLDGLKCSKLLWIDYNAKERIPAADPATQLLFDQGHLVGNEAKKLFPNGTEIDIPHTDIPGTIRSSKEALQCRRPIFEAAFSNGGAYARADILVPVARAAWDIIEVKSSTEVKDVHLNDLALQRYACEGSGVKVRHCYLCHIDPTYVRDGAIELAKLFMQEDVTSQTSGYLERVPGNLSTMRRVITAQRCPVGTLGPHCTDPYDCPLYEKCHAHLPEDNVLTLTRIGTKAYELIQTGVLHVKDIPRSVRLSAVQQIQAEAVRTGKAHLDRVSISEFLRKLEYPLFYLDFETFQTAIPLYDGLRPYQHVPFQFSLHVQEREGGRLRHYGFLGDPRGDPRAEFLRQLKPLLGTTGSIVAYSAGFEKGRLSELAGAFPSYTAWWDRLEPRFIDLYAPFRSFAYYHPLQHGSASIKHLLPALCGGNGYDGMSISDGGAASRAYLDLIPGGQANGEEDKVRRELEEYCQKDTLAMVEVVRALRKL